MRSALLILDDNFYYKSMSKAQVARAFLQNEVPQIIKGLKEDAVPSWGAMSAQEMLEHLIIALKVSMGEIDIPIVTTPDQYDRIRHHLIGDELIPKHIRFSWPNLRKRGFSLH